MVTSDISYHGHGGRNIRDVRLISPLSSEAKVSQIFQTAKIQNIYKDSNCNEQEHNGK